MKLRNKPPSSPSKHTPGYDWRKLVTADEAFILMDLSATVEAALQDMPAEEKGCDEEVNYHSLWVGLLLASGHCATFDRAYAWATFVRYNTTDLCA